MFVQARLLEASPDDWTIRVKIREHDGTIKVKTIGVNHQRSEEEAIRAAIKHVRPRRREWDGTAAEVLDISARRRWQRRAVLLR